MSSFGCCFVWFLFGALLGWLLNYWLCKRCCPKPKETISHYTPPPAAASKIDEPETATTSSMMKAMPTVATPEPVKPKAVPKPKVVAKPKVVPKPKVVAKPATIDIAAAKAAGIMIKSVDDLTVIEGIGPKINTLFKENGLNTFAQIASATVPQMRLILDKGGARYRIANPSTWAKQAKLAANNKWKELKSLQDELSGGVEK